MSPASFAASMREADAFVDTAFIGLARSTKRDPYRLSLFAHHLEPDERPLIVLPVQGGTLIVTGYLMGTMYEHKTAQIAELRETYRGVLMLLRHFISKDEYTEHHSYRVSVYAARIATHLALHPDRVEDVRAKAARGSL